MECHLVKDLSHLQRIFRQFKEVVVVALTKMHFFFAQPKHIKILSSSSFLSQNRQFDLCLVYEVLQCVHLSAFVIIEAISTSQDFFFFSVCVCVSLSLLRYGLNTQSVWVNILSFLFTLFNTVVCCALQMPGLYLMIK